MEFTHIAKPVLVKAQVVRDRHLSNNGLYYLSLEDGAEYQCTEGMVARHIPETGDYLVTQEDGYQYINPKDVFERKYGPIFGVTANDSKAPPPLESLRSASDWQRIDQMRIAALSFAQQTVGHSGESDEVTKAAKKYEAFLRGEEMEQVPVPVPTTAPAPTASTALDVQGSAGGTTMPPRGDFAFALAWLKHGERVRRLCWADGEWIMRLSNHALAFDLPYQLRANPVKGQPDHEELLRFYTGTIKEIFLKGAGNADCECVAWMPTIESCMADDWAVVL